MTAKDFLSAICLKLEELWPDRKAQMSPLSNADREFFVRCTGQSQNQELRRRCKRFYSFEVQYFRQDNDSLSFNSWAETMYQEFKSLSVQGKLYRLSEQRTVPAQGQGCLFQFKAMFWVLSAPDIEEKMEHLTQKEVAE